MRKTLPRSIEHSQREKENKILEEKRDYYDDTFFLRRYENKYIPEYLCWNYNVLSNSFKFIGNSTNFYNIEYYTPSIFLSKIKSCFRSQFIEAVKGFYSMLNNRIIPKEGAHLSIVIPIKLLHDKFLFCKVTIIPNFKQKEIYDFVVIVIPVQQYINSNIIFSILNNGDPDPGLTGHLKNHINPPGISLTKKQQFVLSELHKGLHAPEIAEQLGVVVDAVYKINRRLIEKISDFFELSFKDAKEASEYYYKSFN
jgi:hypothetical protein